MRELNVLPEVIIGSHNLKICRWDSVASKDRKESSKTSAGISQGKREKNYEKKLKK